jgi:hypothetical protein
MDKTITLFGTCRLDSLNNYNNQIRNDISYTYDTKEIIEVIKFIKYNHIPPEKTITTFRTPMINKTPIFSEQFTNVIENTNIFIIEICGKKTYKYNDLHVHSALSDFCDNSIKENIKIIEQDQYEIEEDILKISSLLNSKNIIFVGHIVTDNTSERFKLCEWIEKICIKHNFLFINPVKEINKKGYYNINELIHLGDKKIIHYNNRGHEIMKNIYEEFIDKLR